MDSTDELAVDISPDDIIEHVGVKGMKWGVRRHRSVGSEDSQRHTANKKKGIKNLSDKDLQALVTRMNMEQQVKRLNPSVGKKGHSFAKGLVATVGTASALVTIAKSPAGQALGKALAKTTEIPTKNLIPFIK